MTSPRKLTAIKVGGLGLGLVTLLGVAASGSTALAGQVPAPLDGFVAQRPAPTVSRDAAISRATADSKLGHFDMRSQEARVDRSTADLISLDEADRRLNGRRGGASGSSSLSGNGQVWWVSVQGSFRGESQKGPGGRGETVRSSERIFVYDAASGRLLAMRMPSQ